MQNTIRCGDTFSLTTTLADYPASAGWVLTYRLLPRTAGAAIDIVGTASGDDHLSSASAATTAAWASGEYSWVSYVTKSTQRYTVSEGSVTLLPNPATATEYDARSKAAKALEDAETALANFQSTGGRVKRYSIAGREMEFDNAGEILKLVSYWSIQVTRERAVSAVANGYADPRRIYLRAGRA
jgi:hypothetical protein